MALRGTLYTTYICLKIQTIFSLYNCIMDYKYPGRETIIYAFFYIVYRLRSWGDISFKRKHVLSFIYIYRIEVCFNV